MNDPVAKQYLEKTVDKFRNGQFPKGTQETTFLEFDVQPKNSRNVMTIRTMDYPGEDFRDGITKGTPQEKIKEFAEHLLKSDIIILLIDPKDIPDSENNKQSEKRHKILNSINANLQAARYTLDQKTEKDKTLKADVCIAVTKFDRLPEFEEAKKAGDGGQQVAKKVVSGHWKNFGKNLADVTDIPLKKIEYFPISAVGNTLQANAADAYRDEDNPVIPDKDNLAPFGYDVLFRWIEDRKNRIAWLKFWWLVLMLAIVVIVAVIAAAVWLGGKITIDTVQEQGQLATLDNRTIPVVNRLKDTMPPASDTVTKKRNEILDDELKRYENEIKQTTDEQRLRTYRDELEKYDSSFIGDRNVKVANLLKEISNKLIDTEYQRVKDAYRNNEETFSESANKFLERYPTTEQAKTVRQMLDDFVNKNMDNYRKRIKGTAVYDAGSLQSKGQEISKFLTQYRSNISDGEATAMQRAVELAKQFTEQQEYNVTIKQYGGFAKPEDQILNVFVGNVQHYEHKSNGKSQTVNPDGNFKFTWQCGNVVKIELQGYGGYLYGGVKTAAESSGNKPDALKLLRGKVVLIPKSNDWKPADGGFFVIGSVAEISESDWGIFENYILPGNAW
jgi:hypothetical protein